MSSKNKLQEFCQKHKFPIPEYFTSRSGGSDNDPEWSSSLVYQGVTYLGTGKSKKEAELDAASRVVLEEKQGIEMFKEEYLVEYEKILLVDGENCNFTSPDNFLVIIFAAKNSSRKFSFHKNTFLLLADFIGKDAADFLLTFHAGRFSILHPYAKYYILTKDHYGQYLEHLMPNCKFICSMEEL